MNFETYLHSTGEALFYKELGLLNRPVYVIASRDRLKAVLLGPSKYMIDYVMTLSSKEDTDLLLRVAAWFEAYSQGVSTVPLPPVDLSYYTAQEQQVLEVLIQLPFGETISYGQLAEQAGFPRAARFVGTTMKKNMYPVIIPCHRVIRANNTIGNYGAGIVLKKELLDFEKNVLHNA